MSIWAGAEGAREPIASGMAARTAHLFIGCSFSVTSMRSKRDVEATGARRMWKRAPADSFGRAEPIADSSHGLDAWRRELGPRELGTQPRQMDIDSPRLDEAI